jgi:uncharacterized protein (TIGR00730 family)
MHERKALMATLSDAFIALPGGYGTLDEFFQIVTWAQLTIHSKACVLINTDSYYDFLLRFSRSRSERRIRVGGQLEASASGKRLYGSFAID